MVERMKGGADDSAVQVRKDGGGQKSAVRVRNREEEEVGGGHNYRQLPIVILNAEAQLHLRYDAKDWLTTSHEHNEKTNQKRKKEEKKNKYR